MKTTIIIPFSRKDYINEVFYCLENLVCDTENTDILTYVDGDHSLYQAVRNKTIVSKFRERLCLWRTKGTPSVGSLFRRRQRIADIHNEIKAELKPTDYIFLLEDDGKFASDSLKKLQKTYTTYPYAGLINGVEVGRWGYKHLGLWDFDNVYDPQKITSKILGEGIEKVDATGIYCTLTKYENYMQHKFAPYQKALGPDVGYGIWLREQGLYNYVDYSIRLTHLTKIEKIGVSNSELVQVQLFKEDEKWKTRTI